MLISNFEDKADKADNLYNFCAPVCLPCYMTSSNQSHLKFSCRQVPMTHIVTTQAILNWQSQNGSTAVTTQ